MNLQTFFEQFDQFADAPKAIPAMRELILQLAVRGNLTERIGGESSKPQLDLAEAFRVRRAKREEPDAEDIPFPIPENWGWVAIGDSMDMFNGRAFKPEEWSAKGTPIIRIQNLNNERAAFNRCRADLDPKIHVHDGDLLISWSGTPGTSFGAFIWTRGFAYLNQHIFRCELVKGVFLKAFLRLAINARLDEMISHAQGAVGLRHITKGKLEGIRLPLPPLAEQQRIVAKVDELMALCDRLEAQQQERETRHAALARASLARFADAPNSASLQFLFHPCYAIPPAELRKSILTLAVQGKLVTQDPHDEPAFVSAGSQFDGVFDVPEHWAWIRLADLQPEFQNGASSRGDKDGTSVIVLRLADVENRRISLDSPRAIAISIEQISKYKLQSGDTLITRVNGSADIVGTFIPVQESLNVIYCDHFIRMKIDPERLSPAYTALVGDSQLVREQIRSLFITTAGQKTVNQGHIRSLRIPLPPLAEQRRIVARVDQLMVLVDDLETQLLDSRATAKNLMKAIVPELTSRN